MGKESKLVNEILSLYKTILENKELVEASDVYDNVDFKDNVVGKSTPSKDNINTALLQDIQTAAKSAGLKVDITTAVSGHDTGTRHESGNAVDIAMINGRAVSTSNRADADKLVGVLVQMGYKKNVESGNEKAVLTFGFPGHNNHVHVSNKGGASSVTPSGDTASDTAYKAATKPEGVSQATFSAFNNPNAATDTLLLDPSSQVKSLKNLANETRQIKENKHFGNNISNRYGRLIIPKDSNPKIKSPISGEIINKYSPSCKNQITVKSNGKKTTYLQFCGISHPSVRVGQSISNGDILGKTDTDVEVTMYDDTWNTIKISDNSNTKEYDDVKKKDRNSGQSFSDPLTAMMASVPGKIFNKVLGDKYDKNGNRTQKRWGGVADKEPVDPWLLDLVKSPFKKKVTENIKRIKKLL
jgi:hypothetical protein